MFRVWGLGFGFRVQGFGVWGLGVRVTGAFYTSPEHK